jgi:hypothetical protein
MDEELPWLIIRQDSNGNRYRVARFASRGEAETAAERFDDSRLYLIEETAAAQGAKHRTVS